MANCLPLETEEGRATVDLKGFRKETLVSVRLSKYTGVPTASADTPLSIDYLPGGNSGIVAGFPQLRRRRRFFERKVRAGDG